MKSTGWFFSPLKKKKDPLLHPAIKQNTIPFSGWYCTEVDSVLTMLFSYHLLFWMNGSNPPFYNICFLLWRGAAAEGRHVKVAVWFSFSSPDPAFVPPHPGNVTPRYFTLRCSRKWLCYSLLDIHEIVLIPPAVKDTSHRDSVHKCNAIWLSPTFVLLVQMSEQCTHYTVDLLLS